MWDVRRGLKVKPLIRRFIINQTDSPFLNFRGTSIQGEVRNVEISRGTQQLLNGKSHDFLAFFPLEHSKSNLINEIIQEVSD